MTTLAHRAELHRRKNGGVAARRAIVRWAWRMFRREWRQQILVTALLTVTVAAAIGSVTIAYNSGSADDAEFGSATHLLNFDGADPRKLGAGLAAARDRFGTIDVIGHRSVTVPGGFETVEFRAQDPRGPYGGARLALRRGSYPDSRSQVAVTDGVARLLGLELGETMTLDGQRRTVVGIVENPRELSDEFALVSPSSAGASDHVTVLVYAEAPSLLALRRSLESTAGDGRSPSGTALLGPATRRQTRWRCSPWPPSSSCWPRSSRPQGLPSSHTDGSVSWGCSPRSARPGSTCGSCC